jgi:NADH-quinone oxidoreductase subunit M
MYTVLGSLLLFLGILIIVSTTGTTNYIYLKEYWFSFPKQLVLIFFLLPGFATKMPIYPFHLRLPEAHVEAPTVGSVILAALLLKIGCYGLLRFAVGFTPYGIIYFGPIIFLGALSSSLLASLGALRQVDFKKLIAYSSINHMGLVLAGICSYNTYSLEGSVHLMLSHGLVSAGLFFCIGSLYERFHTKLILYYTGMSKIIPLNMFFLFFFIQGNIAFPGTWSFVSELLIFTGLVHTSILIALTFKVPVFINTVYSVLAFSKVSFGQYTKLDLRYVQDLSYREIIVLSYLLFWSIFFGLVPEIISNLISFYFKVFLIY